MVPRIPEALVTAVCSQTDPFCNHAVGVGRMDDSSVPTLRYTARNQYSFATTIDGGGLIVQFSTDPEHFLAQAGLDATGVQSGVYTGQVLPAFTDASLADAQYRVVSAGLRVINTTNAFDSQGRFRVVSAQGSLRDTGADYGAMATDSATYAFKPGMEVAAIHKWLGAQTEKYRRFGVATSLDPSTSYLQLWLIGAKTGSTFTVEIFYHYEIIIPATTATATLIQAAVRAEPPRDHVMNAAAVVQGNMPASWQAPLSAVSKTLKNAAASALGYVARRGMQYALGAIGGPAGTAAALGLSAIGDIVEVD